MTYFTENQTPKTFIAGAYLDAHIHYFPEIAQILMEAENSSIDAPPVIRVFFVNATSPNDWKPIQNLVEAHLASVTPTIYPFFGIHPWHIANALPDQRTTKRNLLALRQFLERNPDSGVGEIGLDTIRQKSEKDVSIQETIFIEQLKIARELKRPVSLHCVRAWNSMERIFRCILGKNSPLPLLFHGFTGSSELVKQILTGWKLNAYFSLTATRFKFANARSIQLLATIPRNRLFLETDAENVQSAQTLADFYQRISVELSLTPDALQNLIQENQKRFLNF